MKEVKSQCLLANLPERFEYGAAMLAAVVDW